MPLSLPSTLIELLRLLVGLGVSGTMVEVEDERLKVLAKGAKWVSFSSASRVSTDPRRSFGYTRTLGEFPGHGCDASTSSAE